MYLHCKNMGSAGAKELQNQINAMGIKCLRSRRRGWPWGFGRNKVEQLRAFRERGVPHVPFTEIYDEARMWLFYNKIVCRTTVTGHSGRGIVIAERDDELVEAPLYTRYVPKCAEYRVHVLGGEVILVQKKLRKRGVKHNPQIRTNANGYVFGTKFDILDEDKATLCHIAVSAVRAAALAGGAVDIIYSKKLNQFLVLEINTSPGLSPSTAKIYAEAIARRL